MSSGVKDLKVWQEAVALAGDVVRAARQATRRETKSFTDPLMQSAVAVACWIAHGYASFGAAEQRVAYQDARRALLDLETRLTIARLAGILQATTLAQLTGRIATVSRLLSGYVAYIDRQAAAGTGLALPVGALTVRTPLADEVDFRAGPPGL
jgi:four helix bundle protein